MDVFTALADPVRRAVLRQLTAGPARVVDIAAQHPVTRPAISRHLRILGEAGLVRGEDRGRERLYTLDPGPLDDVRRLLADLTDIRPPVPVDALDALETEIRRTSRERTRTTHLPHEETA